MPEVQTVNPVPIPWGGDRYMPIRMDSIRLDTTPDFALYFRPSPEQPFVLYCERNLPFTRAARKRLENSRVSCLYIKQEERLEYNRYLANHLEDILRDPKLNVKEKSTILYDSAQAVVEEVLAQPPTRETIDRGKEVVQQTINFMTAEDFMIEHLLRAISCDYYLYTHSVNVVAYSVALAMRTGQRNSAMLREIANGALLHDVGKRALNAALLNKTTALSAEEWERMKTHPFEGHRMLREFGAIGEIALDIVLHHHEKLDGTGYPEGLKNDAISPFVRMVSIADIFDALTTERYHQKPHNTFEALKIMQRDMRSELDKDLLRAFVDVMAARLKG
ncbi:MAG TPA: HD domain-containing protein [Candidatus Hydrogenedentes bacterium]|nr:HD domain-containing protein [Candidatus Hydrogenedentota bacterium]